MAMSIIVAMAHNNVIGANNGLPWHLPADLKHFKAITMGKPIVMGRKTFQSIGRPLPGRRNIVITRDRNWHADGVEIAESVEIAAQLTADDQEAMIIGGAQIYSAFLPAADRLYVTEIDKDVAGDTYFPSISEKDWMEISRTSHDAKDEAPPYSFVMYERR